MRRAALRSKALVIVGVLVASVLSATPALAAPQIRFLNPSNYTTPITISDKEDGDSTVHLVAWVKEVPANPLVEFEIQATAGNPITIDAFRASDDTWEADLSVASLTDGSYTLRARLYANVVGPGTGQEIAVTEQTVSLNRSSLPPPPAADTVELTSPTNGGQLPYFAPKGKATNALLRAITSEDVPQVRAFYTVSAPGNDPTWVSCGSAAVTDRLATVRCTLEDGVNGAQVTAVAVVANTTPTPATPSPFADATGDAHRVMPTAQIPTSIEVTPPTVTAEKSACQTLVATLRDQVGRVIAGANVDVHATGPDDQIRFGSISNTTSAFQAPDSGHVSQRAARNCANGENSGFQGDHNIPGADDPQHIESTAGTSNAGQFTFALYSDTGVTTEVVAWADVNDDDASQATETSGGARVGWGAPPEPATPTLTLEPRSASSSSGTCERFVAAARQGGSPLAGRNVDVHITGPGAGVTFCTPEGGSSTRAPDQGSHVGDSDGGTTKHAEGETDASGNLVFGVVSLDAGTTQLTVWLDTSDNDVLESGEPSQAGTIEWVISGDRTIGIDSNRRKVRKGRFVKIFGSIDGAPACEAQQTVKLKSKRLRGGRFATIRSKSTDSEGDYSFRVRVRKSKKYRTVAPTSGACRRAASRTITVRAI